MPVPINGEKDEFCRAIISWGLQLVAGLVAKEKGEKTLQYLGKLPVPCIGGWYPLNETSFGPGWYQTVGQQLKSYLDAINSDETKEATKKLLLPPSDEHWNINVFANSDLLEKAGAFSGIRLLNIKSEDWKSDFVVSGRQCNQFSRKTPHQGYDKDIWTNYIADVKGNLKPKFRSRFRYKVDNLFIIPGIDRYSTLRYDASSRFHARVIKFNCKI